MTSKSLEIWTGLCLEILFLCLCLSWILKLTFFFHVYCIVVWSKALYVQLLNPDLCNWLHLHLKNKKYICAHNIVFC